ncbi:hypothetical protein LU604_01345 [Erwinia tracheiphila]|uniref:hypothetical protein n=1 Tax=Erwinia tracheiphila TaxID=65700 RepID=UPI001F1BA267|nr:hypothetical protein [Erwinia tracheiphila]UIA83797.1 hypothetical protein LU604_01345 [Erwinia tracheiphila]
MKISSVNLNTLSTNRSFPEEDPLRNTGEQPAGSTGTRCNERQPAKRRRVEQDEPRTVLQRSELLYKNAQTGTSGGARGRDVQQQPAIPPHRRNKLTDRHRTGPHPDRMPADVSASTSHSGPQRTGYGWESPWPNKSSTGQQENGLGKSRSRIGSQSGQCMAWS